MLDALRQNLEVVVCADPAESTHPIHRALSVWAHVRFAHPHRVNSFIKAAGIEHEPQLCADLLARLPLLGHDQSAPLFEGEASV
jgi:hypothetical protein